MMMQITKNERKELDSLSKDVFGVSSRWQKLVEKGHQEVVMQEVTETVPSEKEGEEPVTRQVQVPVTNDKGHKQVVLKRYTVEEVRVLMLDYKVKLDEIRAMVAKQQEEAKAKQEAAAKQLEEEQRAKELHKQLSGSAS